MLINLLIAQLVSGQGAAALRGPLRRWAGEGVTVSQGRRGAREAGMEHGAWWWEGAGGQTGSAVSSTLRSILGGSLRHPNPTPHLVAETPAWSGPLVATKLWGISLHYNDLGTRHRLAFP